MELHRDSPLTALPNVGASRAKALARLALSRVGDLLQSFPRGYEDRSKLFDIRSAPEGEPVCIRAMVAEPPRLSRIRAGLELVKTKVVDGGGVLHLTFFNQAYLKTALKQGESYTFFGKVECLGGARSMTNPVFEREGAERLTGRIVPIYRLTAGISNNILLGLTRHALDACLDEVPETLPEQIRLSHKLAQARFSFENIHFPPPTRHWRRHGGGWFLKNFSTSRQVWHCSKHGAEARPHPP